MGTWLDLHELSFRAFPTTLSQRGNRGQEVFLRESDYPDYLSLMSEWCGKQHTEVWAYCLMPNHIHLIAVPQGADALQNAIGEAHRRYTRLVSGREGWSGHLWQGRFDSFPMDDRSLLEVARYIELNPMHAGIVKNPGEYPWSPAIECLSKNGAHPSCVCPDRIAGSASIAGLRTDTGLHHEE